MLRQMGVEVIGPVGDLDGALHLARHAEVDGAILDVCLRGRGVYPVVEALQARGCPPIFATGYDPAALPRAVRQLPRLRKPFGAGKLERLLAGVFRLRPEADREGPAAAGDGRRAVPVG